MLKLPTRLNAGSWGCYGYWNQKLSALSAHHSLQGYRETLDKEGVEPVPGDLAKRACILGTLSGELARLGMEETRGFKNDGLLNLNAQPINTF
jgi:hypothetical protein